MSYSLYKFLGSLTEPMNFFAVFLLFLAFLAVFGGERSRKVGRIGILVLALALSSLLVVPLGQWALLPLENRYATHEPKEVDGILVLTGNENAFLSEARGVPIVAESGSRHLALARLAKRYPKAKIVVVGDPTPRHVSSKVSVQTVVQEVLDGAGVPRARVLYETKSRTTRENALMAKEIAKPREGEKWLLLTSAFHMPRSVLCFEKAGWEVIPYPTDYFTPPRPQKPCLCGMSAEHQLRLLTRAAHEYVGLLVYWAAGWIERPWK